MGRLPPTLNDGFSKSRQSVEGRGLPVRLLESSRWAERRLLGHYDKSNSASHRPMDTFPQSRHWPRAAVWNIDVVILTAKIPMDWKSWVLGVKSGANNIN